MASGTGFPEEAYRDPDAGAPSHALWLYRSGGDDFPLRWGRFRRLVFERFMLVGRALDPVLIRGPRGAGWFLMLFDQGLGVERVFTSYRFDAGYVEHPQSRRYSVRHTGPPVAWNGLGGGSPTLWALLRDAQPAAQDGPGAPSLRRILALNATHYEYGGAGRPLAAAWPGWTGAGDSLGLFPDGGQGWVAVADGWSADASRELARCLEGGSPAGTPRACWQRRGRAGPR